MRRSVKIYLYFVCLLGFVWDQMKEIVGIRCWRSLGIIRIYKLEMEM